MIELKYREDLSDYKYTQLLHRQNLIGQGSTKYPKYIPYVEVYVDTKRRSKDDIALLFIYRSPDYRIQDGETNYIVVEDWHSLTEYLDRLGIVLNYLKDIKELIS